MREGEGGRRRREEEEGGGGEERRREGEGEGSRGAWEDVVVRWARDHFF